jgi:citrate synthase
LGFLPLRQQFAIPPTANWLPQWQELITDAEQKIARPEQIYTGHEAWEFVPMDKWIRGLQPPSRSGRT